MGRSDGEHTRAAGEYVRPAKVLVLIDRAGPQGEGFAKAVRGVPYHRNRFHGRKDGDQVWLELVPEPRNVHDSHAVAVDFECHRIGYLPADQADSFHDIVCAANKNGYVARTTARLSGYEFETGESHFVPMIVLPTYERLREIGTRFGLRDEVVRLVGAFDADTRWRIIRERDGLSEELMDRLFQVAHLAPSFRWPGEGPSGRFPGALNDYLRDLYFDERVAQAERKRQESAARKAARAELHRQDRERRAAEKEAEKDRLRHCVETGVAAGQSVREMAAALEISESRVSNLKHELGLNNASNWSVDQRDERLERCEAAIRFQDAGLTRREIAEKLGVQVDTVKPLLRDGRFYDNPVSNHERLELALLADTAKSRGLTKSQFKAEHGLSGAKSMEGWKDAGCLRLRKLL